MPLNRTLPSVCCVNDVKNVADFKRAFLGLLMQNYVFYKIGLYGVVKNCIIRFLGYYFLK